MSASRRLLLDGGLLVRPERVQVHIRGGWPASDAGERPIVKGPYRRYRAGLRRATMKK
jgi:hypothetical protein